MAERRFHSETDFIVRLAGEGGEGAISCGELFALAAARTEYHVFTFITYPAEIKGGFTMAQIRVRDWTIYSLGSWVDCLLAFSQPAYEQARADLRPEGILIYDSDTVTPADDAWDLGDIEMYPVPLGRLAGGSGGGPRTRNMAALGVLGALFGIDRTLLGELVEERYRGKGPAVREMNAGALSAGYDAVAEKGWPLVLDLAARPSRGQSYMFLSGNEAIALGALVAGCRFAAGYPITPASSLFETLTRLLPLAGGRALQMEDEIAAVSAAIGASFGGERALVPTSGPGFQLMAEQLNLASMIEVPLVVADVQRGGPSTGLPTKTEQSDLNFAIYGTSGESPRIILAPTSVEDSFYQTIRAFNLAERYQVPVILLSDQSIGYRKATVRMPDLEKIVEVDSKVARTKVKIPDPHFINLVSRSLPKPQELVDYRRYRITEDGVSAIAVPGTPGGQYLATGLEHTERGKPDYSPEVHERMSGKRFRKLSVISRSFESNPIESHGKPDAEIGIIGWGSTEGAIREARYLAEQNGIHVRHLHPHTLSPMPEKQIIAFLHRLEYVIVVEENYTGQFADFIRSKFGVRVLELHKCQGVPFTPQEIWRGIEKVADLLREYSVDRL